MPMSKSIALIGPEFPTFSTVICGVCHKTKGFVDISTQDQKHFGYQDPHHIIYILCIECWKQNKEKLKNLGGKADE
jgi:hypothetical protein